jgi:hypothetical protein
LPFHFYKLEINSERLLKENIAHNVQGCSQQGDYRFSWINWIYCPGTPL